MGIFDWLKKKPTIESYNVLKRSVPRPALKDWTDDFCVNLELTRGLYHNTYPGMKLAGGLAFPPIAIPVNFMGLPVPKPVDDKDEKTEKELVDMLAMFSDVMPKLHTFCSVDGTIWVWPFYSKKANRLIWEVIDDDSVSTIVKDIETKEIIKIITDEEIVLTVDYNKNVNIKRRRTFTRQEISIEYFGTDRSVPDQLKSVKMRNPFNVLPIEFANNNDPNEKRGHSDYERIVTDLKDYHDLDLARSKGLAKFQPKLVQAVTNGEDWLKNLLKANSISEIEDLDIATIDLILNKVTASVSETTEILWPDKANQAYAEALEQKFMKIVEASGVPEIVWGLKTKNNSNSAEVSLDGLIKYVHGKQDQISEAYKKLFSASLAIMRFVRFGAPVPEVKITWNDLDAVSDEVRSNIFKNFADGLSKLVNVAGITKEQMFKLFQQMYPTITEEQFEEFKAGITDMAIHNQFRKASFSETRDLTGAQNDAGDDDLPEDIPPMPEPDTVEE